MAGFCQFVMYVPIFANTLDKSTVSTKLRTDFIVVCKLFQKIKIMKLAPTGVISSEIGGASVGVGKTEYIWMDLYQ